MYKFTWFYLVQFFMCLLFPCSDGIKVPSDITTVKFDGIVNTLKTGDLVLFSGATTSGALIKLFDNAEFSHIGLVSFAIFYYISL